MARNRKHQSAAVRFGPAIKVLLLCSFIVGAGVGYVWQKQQLLDLGRRKAALERRLSGLQSQTEQLQGRLMWLRSPQVLETNAGKLNLGLRIAQANQIVYLTEPLTIPPVWPAEGTARQYARRDSGARSNQVAGR